MRVVAETRRDPVRQGDRLLERPRVVRVHREQPLLPTRLPFTAGADPFPSCDGPVGPERADDDPYESGELLNERGHVRTLSAQLISGTVPSVHDIDAALRGIRGSGHRRGPGYRRGHRAQAGRGGRAGPGDRRRPRRGRAHGGGAARTRPGGRGVRVRRGRPCLGRGRRRPGRRLLRLARRPGQQRLRLYARRPAVRGPARRDLGPRSRPHPDRRAPLLPGRASAPGRLRPGRRREHRLRERSAVLRQPRLQRGQGGPRLPHPHPRRARRRPRGPRQPGRAGHRTDHGLGGP